MSRKPVRGASIDSNRLQTTMRIRSLLRPVVLDCIPSPRVIVRMWKSLPTETEVRGVSTCTQQNVGHVRPS